MAAVRAATGWDVTVDELLEVGERAVNLARLFNVREGFTRADDRLPDRLHDPLEGGPLTGRSIDRDAFEAAITGLFELKGWDPATGVPTPERLRASASSGPAGAGGRGCRLTAGVPAVKVHLWGELGFYGPDRRSRFEVRLEGEMPLLDAASA